MDRPEDTVLAIFIVLALLITTFFGIPEIYRMYFGELKNDTIQRH
jgi:hypothetical protein